MITLRDVLRIIIRRWACDVDCSTARMHTRRYNGLEARRRSNEVEGEYTPSQAGKASRVVLYVHESRLGRNLDQGDVDGDEDATIEVALPKCEVSH